MQIRTRHRHPSLPHPTCHLSAAPVGAACEHAFAHLKNRRIPTKLRLHARHATTLLRTRLILTSLEIAH
ncbi:hypothetical protein OHA71_15585 [Streptomyces sp. NBC_00444]|uniref:hypothetical protein n=1 Tax=Streptomyces sp. NBC_00444 TaxID=2975744 RepID=UPI002E22A155